MKRVYVSSTYDDLKKHRAAVYGALRKMRYDAIAMEDYVARDARMVDQVLRDVAECDFYVGIFAWRYGYVPPQGNPAKRSITELEYREAKAKGKPRLVFMLDPKARWPREFMDSKTGKNDKGKRIERLRAELQSRMHSPFSNPKDLALAVMPAVHLAETDAKAQVLSSELSSASCLTMQSSKKPEILNKIRCAITEEAKTDVMKVNLGKGQEWWSTRLHLLSALCGDYTEVRQFLFESDEYRFLGMCTPSQARRALARSFPEVEVAYRNSLPSPGETSSDPVEDVRSIVDRFSSEMDRLGGEESVKRWVEPHVVQTWAGVDKGCVEVSGGAVSLPILEAVVRRQTPFVVLVKDGIIQEVVNRGALATRMAIAAL